jgi:hypothetical protein
LENSAPESPAAGTPRTDQLTIKFRAHGAQSVCRAHAGVVAGE